jgi:hypothetical protein
MSDGTISYSQTTERSPTEGGDVATQDFLFQPTVIFPSSLPLAYVNQTKALAATEVIMCL